MNTKDELSFAEWLENASWQAWKIFDMMGWTWFYTPGVPTQEQIKDKIMELVCAIFEVGGDAAEVGRIKVCVDRESGELSLYIELDTFFADVGEIECSVDLLDEWLVTEDT